jgi:hypothetical protein
MTRGRVEDTGMTSVRPRTVSRFSWPPAMRLVVSLALVAYLAAVIVPPLAGPPPASDLAMAALQPLRPLVGALFLGHGYRFFAPNPGPGHSIQWTMKMADGSTRQGSIPDRDADWPRLLYHRRFMISEKIAAFVPPPDAPVDVRQQSRGDWQPLVKDVAGHLLHRYGGAQVTLQMTEHYLPDPEELSRTEQGGTEQGRDTVTPLGTYALAGSHPPAGLEPTARTANR